MPDIFKEYRSRFSKFFSCGLPSGSTISIKCTSVRCKRIYCRHFTFSPSSKNHTHDISRGSCNSISKKPISPFTCRITRVVFKEISVIRVLPEVIHYLVRGLSCYGIHGQSIQDLFISIIPYMVGCRAFFINLPCFIHWKFCFHSESNISFGYAGNITLGIDRCYRWVTGLKGQVFFCVFSIISRNTPVWIDGFSNTHISPFFINV